VPGSRGADLAMTTKSLGAPVLLAVSVLLLYSAGLGNVPTYLSWDEAMFALQAHAMATTAHDIEGRFLPFYFHVTPLGSNMWFQPALVYHRGDHRPRSAERSARGLSESCRLEASCRRMTRWRRRWRTAASFGRSTRFPNRATLQHSRCCRSDAWLSAGVVAGLWFLVHGSTAKGRLLVCRAKKVLERRQRLDGHENLIRK
jgi:hypothetical protein